MAKKNISVLKVAAPGSTTCGCGTCDESKGRKAVGVDPGIKEANLMRLRRIEGQVRGILKMVESDRYCADVLTQLSAVQEALRGVTRELLHSHLRHCVTSSIRQGGDEADRVTAELADLFHKAGR